MLEEAWSVKDSCPISTEKAKALIEGKSNLTSSAQGRRKNALAALLVSFAAPKSVSLLLAFAPSEKIREIVLESQREAVHYGLQYLYDSAGYTRVGTTGKGITFEKLPGCVSFGTDKFTSAAGDPHLSTTVTIPNYQLFRDGKLRTLDSYGFYRQVKPAGYLYQTVLRAALTQKLGIQWGAISHGVANIAELDSPELLEPFSRRSSRIKRWQADNPDEYPYAAVEVTRFGLEVNPPNNGKAPAELHAALDRALSHPVPDVAPLNEKSPFLDLQYLLDAIQEKAPLVKRSDVLMLLLDQQPWHLKHAYADIGATMPSMAENITNSYLLASPGDKELQSIRPCNLRFCLAGLKQ